jgi:tetratricopeptide (TPR) repeat protein
MSEKTAKATSASDSLDQGLQAINRNISGNRLAEAISDAEKLSQLPAAKIPALALLALAAALAGERDKALTALREIPEPGKIAKAEILLAAGSAWFKLDAVPNAIAFLSAAVARAPEHPLINARLGACLLAIGRLTEALPHLEKAVERMPNSGGAWLNLAKGRMEAGRMEAALEALDKAASLPDKEEDIYNLTRAEILTRLGRSPEAETLLRQAVSGNRQGAVEALVNLLGYQGKHDEAWQVMREALEESPENPSLLELAAELAQIRGRFGEAGRYLDQALKIAPENAALWRRRAMLAGRRFNDAGGGRAAADKALELTRERGGQAYALSLATHASILSEEKKYTEAESAYRESLELFPNCIPALNGLGHLLMQLGRVEEAMALFERLKEIAPLQGWSQLIQAREVPDDPAVLAQLEKAARRPSLEGPTQSHLLFTLAMTWERKKDFAKAWEFATAANAASKERLSYRPEVHRQHVEREMARFSKEFMKSRAGYGDPSPLPVFVLGMPRSGTTLVEQILGSHSKVFGAGELSLVPELIQKFKAWETKLGSRREYPECIDDLGSDESRRFAEKHLAELRAYAPEAERIVDKLPHNFEHIGLIKLLFPNAKILHLKREPRDVAMSNYFTDYAAKFGGMGFAYDLSWIGEQLVDHQRLMDHWHKVFPGEILEVDYDSLVEDVEGWARKIIKYLDLRWEKNVLSFQNLERAVKTASVWQVRQPVYTSSKAKWKNYAEFLAPLEAALAETPPPPVPLPLPKLPPGVFLVGMEHLKSGRPAEAEKMFRDLLNARPSHAAARHFLGAALHAQKKLEEARKEMRRSIELLDSHPQWFENLARTEEALGNHEEATRLRSRLSRRSRRQRGNNAPAPDTADGPDT